MYMYKSYAYVLVSIPQFFPGSCVTRPNGYITQQVLALLKLGKKITINEIKVKFLCMLEKVRNMSWQNLPTLSLEYENGS